MSALAIPAPAHLGPVVTRPTVEWQVRKDLRGVLRRSFGGARQQLAAAPPGFPEKAYRRTFSLSWDTLAETRDRIERYLAPAGVKELRLWRHEHLSFRGTGTRTEWYLPWPQALDALPASPEGVAPAHLATRAQIGLEGPPLTVATLDSEAFAGGIPAAGEVWLESGTGVLKTRDPLVTGERLFVEVIPVFSVLEESASEVTLRDPVSEPRRLVLVEA